MITIASNGPAIATTNYWSTEHAKRGLLYLSINAGTLRMLVPRASQHMLDDLPPVGRAVTLIRSTLHGKETYLLEWEEPRHTGLDPYVVEIDQEQYDRRIPDDEDGRVLPLVWYVQAQGSSIGVREARRERVQISKVVAS